MSETTKIIHAMIKEKYLRDKPHKIKTNESNGNDDSSEIKEPPRKKQKQRGQNHSRSKQNKITYSIKLCPDIARGRECKFGVKCKFSHDVDRYLKHDKPKDIGKRCILFEALGELSQ